ncbi:uncharacterized protein MONOS_13862 [Monocercomonoides exilis]|uniref:uncharacterized protein n=1 Tax=Monocercomonoides exilis TaxID=2049356 RepID=UPI00355A703A|nr:hypothetical protein MONOS_13862 [Monocercomonoides exilis]|eukprot:MONOS_13862.1-p1 / transcript=MONOS_13862.1 / gene=MONOS_13862 / organism=Monocercomonoides_exilis_PA203 / gene_product=unspecified product / transcript_product=unspecified product / location=Mono_scaffold00896:160-2226(-) / protein_length=689 / sequence_SO=supercontig / SO=protein_coding / is_pseudo=false
MQDRQALETSDFSETYEYSTTEAELSEYSRMRIKAQRRALHRIQKHKNVGTYLREDDNAEENRLGHFRHPALNQDGTVKRDDEGFSDEEYAPQQRARYVSRSMFDMLFGSINGEESHEKLLQRKQLWSKWEPLLETTIANQERYLKDMESSKFARKHRQARRRAHSWRNVQVPKNFKNVLRREPDPDFLASVESNLLEYIHGVQEKLLLAYELCHTDDQTTVSSSAQKEDSSSASHPASSSSSSPSSSSTTSATASAPAPKSEAKLPHPGRIKPFVVRDNDAFHRLLAHCVGKYYGFHCRSLRLPNGKVRLEMNGVYSVLRRLPELTLSEYVAKWNASRNKGLLKRRFKEDKWEEEEKEERRRKREEEREEREKMEEEEAIEEEKRRRRLERMRREGKEQDDDSFEEKVGSPRKHHQKPRRSGAKSNVNPLDGLVEAKEEERKEQPLARAGGASKDEDEEEEEEYDDDDDSSSDTDEFDFGELESDGEDGAVGKADSTEEEAPRTSIVVRDAADASLQSKSLLTSLKKDGKALVGEGLQLSVMEMRNVLKRGRKKRKQIKGKETKEMKETAGAGKSKGKGRFDGLMVEGEGAGEDDNEEEEESESEEEEEEDEGRAEQGRRGKRKQPFDKRNEHATEEWKTAKRQRRIRHRKLKQDPSEQVQKLLALDKAEKDRKMEIKKLKELSSWK